MNETILTIYFNDGTFEEVECFDYQITKNGILRAYKRFGSEEKCYPISSIKKYEVQRVGSW